MAFRPPVLLRFGCRVTARRRGYEPNTNRVAHQTGHIVYAQTFHDFAAMAFHRLDAEAEPLGYFARPIPFSDKLEHLDLTISKRVQRLPCGECVTDRCLESTRERFENDVFSSGSYCRAGLTAGESACNDYEGHGWPYVAQYLQRGSPIKVGE